MFYWIYDVPSFLVVALFVTVFVGACFLGTLFLRPRRRWVHEGGGSNEILGDFLQYFGVIYGLLLGLLAVATYQNHADAERAVSNEASALAALYRDVSVYPEPMGTDLRSMLAEYTKYVIEDAWPLQRQGRVPEGGVDLIATFHAKLVGFEPQTKGQEAMHDVALRQFNTFFEFRRARLYSVTASIPIVMWLTVALGAVISIILIWLFDLRLAVHILLGGLISLFTATMICLIVLLDQPYRGEMGVSPAAFELIYGQLMKG